MLIYFLFSLLLIEDIPCNLIKKIIITSDHISVLRMCLEMNIFKTSDGENTNNTPAQKMTYKRAANKQISHFFTNYCQYHENIRIKLYFKHSIQVIIIKINRIIYIYGTRINIHPLRKCLYQSPFFHRIPDKKPEETIKPLFIPTLP